ncbi:hypothetical protein [Desulfofustis limnaeus]|uniref:Uncharacterized protein n=1 Tax=Desulfofustis limnaeus TaxID=2740163 RepID=A0ABM7W9K4_9BACT|nr:hypothetical protein [Desulfofustis limnaeus]BDD87672.1 hypothetical protein DPPLL_20370 [Desulfofustis limnaeus]
MHTKFFRVAGITLQVESDLPLTEATFAPKFKLFEVDGPGDDTILLRHRFQLPPTPHQFGREIYRKSPWLIYSDDHRWTYILETSPDPKEKKIRQLSQVSLDHTRLDIYNSPLVLKAFEKGNAGSLTLAPTDQILLARLLADRSGCYLHSDGMKMDDHGLLFVGHSGAGKSTIATMMQDKAEILCDDRMIVRKWDDEYHIHGNWSHGTLPIVSANSAPLKGIFFLEQAPDNVIQPLANRVEIISLLLGCLIKPMVSKDWWEKMLNLVEDLADRVPCYRLRFDKSGEIYHRLQELLRT